MNLSLTRKIVSLLLLLILPVFVFKRYTLFNPAIQKHQEESMELEEQSHAFSIRVLAIDSEEFPFEQALPSLLYQQYSNYQVDLLSLNHHRKKEVHKIADQKAMKKRIHWIHCRNQKDLMLQFHRFLLSLNGNEIVVFLGNRSALSSDQALAKIANIYRSENIELCYGQYFCKTSQKIGFQDPLGLKRQGGSSHSHKLFWLRSPIKIFYAGLYQQLLLKEEDLQSFDSFDQLLSYQMAPMAEFSKKKIRLIKEVLTVYFD